MAWLWLIWPRAEVFAMVSIALTQSSRRAGVQREAGVTEGAQPLQ